MLRFATCQQSSGWGSLTSSPILPVPQKLDHSSFCRLGSLLPAGSLSRIAWKNARSIPSATYLQSGPSFERDVRLTQLRTRSNMRYSSSSTNVDASYGISTSSGAHPRTFRTRLSLAYRILRKVSALPTSPGPYSPRNAPLQIIRRYSIGQISPRLCSSGLLYSEGTHVPAPPDG